MTAPDRLHCEACDGPVQSWRQPITPADNGVYTPAMLALAPVLLCRDCFVAPESDVVPLVTDRRKRLAAHFEPKPEQIPDDAAALLAEPAAVANSCMVCFAPIASGLQSCAYCAHRVSERRGHPWDYGNASTRENRLDKWRHGDELDRIAALRSRRQSQALADFSRPRRDRRTGKPVEWIETRPHPWEEFD